MIIDTRFPDLNQHIPIRFSEVYVVGTGGNGDDDDEDQMYILVTEDGREVPAVLVDERTVFNATSNDIRLGKTAATEQGVTLGEKEIPAYHTTEGVQFIPAGAVVAISDLPRYEYTKLQALMCDFNSNLSNSVATRKVSIDGGVYAVGSAEALATVTIEAETETINFNIRNDGEKPCILRYFTYKEEY